MNVNRHGGNEVVPALSGLVCSKTQSVRHQSRQGDQGFTLVELLIVLVILPIVIGAITLSLVSVLSLRSSVSDRLGASADAQVVAASFYNDVQSAAQFTTMATPSGPGPCGTSSQILGLEWGVTSTKTVVSYAVVPNGTVNAQGVVENSLIRYQCSWVSGSTPPLTPTLTDTQTLSYNVPIASGLPVHVQGRSCTSLLDVVDPTCAPLGTTPWTAGWAPATGVQYISLTAYEAATNSKSYDHSCPSGVSATFCYSVAAAPRNWEKIPVSGNPPPPVSGLVPAEFIGSSGVDLKTCASGNPNVDVNGEVVIDSTSDPATNGKNNLYSTTVSYVSSEGTPTNLGGSPTLNPISQPAADPLAGLPAPDTTGMAANPAKQTINGVTYASPGIYTSALSGTLTLKTGIYVLENGISGNITSGVGGNLLYVTGGTVSPAGMDLWPMTSGPYAGLVLWQGPSSQPYDTTVIDSGGNSVAQLGGIVYAPGANFDWHGDASYWVGALLTGGLSCSGGGNGELNIGYYQSISFTAPSTGSVGSNITASATGGASGNPVVFSIDNLSESGVCSATGTNGRAINFLKAGTCLIDANQAQSDQSAGQGGYLEAPTVQQSVQVG